MPVFKKSESGQSLLLVILGVVIVGAVMIAGGAGKIPQPKEIGQSFSANPTVSPGPSQGALQLQTLDLNPITPTSPPAPTAAPPPANFCPGIHDDPTCHVANSCGCNGGQTYVCHNARCQDSYASRDPINERYGCDADVDTLCSNCAGIVDGIICMGKPVIMLYPEVTTNVDVEVETNGKIVVSDPTYPAAGGWKNVVAYPGGKLEYQGQSYTELFYESEVKSYGTPKKGIIIPMSELKPRLTNLIYQLGLNQNESDEFLSFWIPKLKALNSNYILFSLLSPEVKKLTDNVVINPVPKTQIEFIVHFKPLSIPVVIEPLVLPARPERIGFTEVEWGGEIDNSTNPVLF